MDRIPVPSMVVLVGPSGSGKSTWAAATFGGRDVVSSDALRALVGEDEGDQRASPDAFALLEAAVAARLRRRLTTVVDSTGLDPADRSRWLAAGRAAGLPVLAVVFETTAAQCKERNRARDRRVPVAVIDAQCRRFRDERPAVDDEGWDHVVVVQADTPAAVVAPVAMVASAVDDVTPPGDRAGLRFGLHLSRFGLDGGAAELGASITEVAQMAEDIGFASFWVMDHAMQIPQVGRAWDDILEPFTTLAHVAASTSTMTVGPLVAGVTHRNLALLGSTVASLDVLSGGRAVCGIGAAWYEREHRAHGHAFPPAGERLDLLEDALEFLPILWGPGTKGYEGRRFAAAEAFCYPRPVRGTIPILVGGQGERRTLALAARHADACNLFGDPDDVRHKLDVLHAHCDAVDRDPAEIAVTHLSTVLVGGDADDVRALVDRHGPARGVERWMASVNAGTVDDHVRRASALAGAGVDEVIVAVEGLGRASDLERLAPLVAAFE